MARILKCKRNNLKRKYIKYRLGYTLSFLGVLGLPLYLKRMGILATFFLMLAFFIIIRISSNEVNKIKSGLVGEKRSKRILNSLSNKYYLLPNLQIKVDGLMGEMDHVVVGENGIFVIESKNSKGLIKGNDGDREFVQFKTGRNGGQYSKTFYSPIKQVNTHVYKLSQLLKSNGYRQWIQGVVLFTNSEASLNVNSRNIPVFKANEEGIKSLLYYIETYKSKDKMSKNECKEVAEFIHSSRR